jgi:phage gp36-like protein
MIYYCDEVDLGKTENGVSDTLLRLCDDKGAGTWNDDCQKKFDGLRKAATDLINSYAVKKYKVPFENVPGTIREICKVIFWYKLYATRSAATEQMRKDYEDQVKFLEKLSRNEVGILELDQQTEQESQVKPKARIFSNRSKSDRKFIDGLQGY